MSIAQTAWIFAIAVHLLEELSAQNSAASGRGRPVSWRSVGHGGRPEGRNHASKRNAPRQRNAKARTGERRRDPGGGAWATPIRRPPGVESSVARPEIVARWALRADTARAG